MIPPESFVSSRPGGKKALRRFTTKTRTREGTPSIILAAPARRRNNSNDPEGAFGVQPLACPTSVQPEGIALGAAGGLALARDL